METQSKMGICATCGLHGKNMGPGYEVFPILEVTQRERDNKRLEQYQTRNQKFRLRAFPVCFAGIDLDNANELQRAGQDYDQAFTSILYRERGVQGCSKWVQYRPNLDPQWHLDDFKMQQLEQDRREFEQRMEKERKEFELKLDERNREERRRTDKIMVWLTIAAIIFALAEVAAGIMGITDDSWILRFFR